VEHDENDDDDDDDVVVVGVVKESVCVFVREGDTTSGEEKV